jgi:alpha-L-fucosidase 2
MKYILVIAFLFLISCGNQVMERQDENLVLKYVKPAKAWTEALPVGNGRLGAMIYGNPLEEHLQLNENTLYSGEPSAMYKEVDVRPTYDTIRKLLKDGKNAEAEKLVAENWLGRLHQCYQPLGDLKLNFEGEKISNFYRNLDIANSIATVGYQADGVEYKREVLASFPDQIIAIKISANKKSSISFNAFFESVHPTCKSVTSGNKIKFKGQAPGYASRRTLEFIEGKKDQYKHPEIFEKNGERKSFAKQVLYADEVDGKGMFFEAQLEVRAVGGEVIQSEEGMSVSNADEVLLLLSMATSFNGFDKSPSRDGKDPEATNNAILSKLNDKSYATIKEKHQKDYKNLFNRVKLDLNSEINNDELSTRERFRAYATQANPQLNTLLFQYGRYLMISGSREGGQALNLKGIWNDKVISMWNSGYTLNINAEMNYWPAEITNLSECHEPFFSLIKECAINGKETAQKMYGNRGWVTHHNVDIWRPTYPNDNEPKCSYWPMGAGWLTSHLWEHYQFTQDTEFLKNTAYPLMKGAAEFLSDWLVENNEGFLVTPVSFSPENTYKLENGDELAIGQGATMDMSIIKELFERTIKAAEMLDVDQELRTELLAKYEKLLPYKIGKYGQLQEWEIDHDELEITHRHISHLYALYPGNQISKQQTPELYKAALKTLERRGDEAAGWSMGWKINFWARMQDGNHAKLIMDNLFNWVEDNKKKNGWTGDGGLYPNLFSGQPFTIEANFGYTAGVAEMLIQSQNNEIHLLPALPKVWNTGSVSGLKARGNIEIGIDWKDGKVVKATFKSPTDKTIKLRINNKVESIELKADKTATLKI